MKIDDLPPVIKALAIQRREEYKSLVIGTKVSDSFGWTHTPEGSTFWSSIDEGNFQPYYDKYGHPDTKADLFEVGDVVRLISYGKYPWYGGVEDEDWAKSALKLDTDYIIFSKNGEHVSLEGVSLKHVVSKFYLVRKRPISNSLIGGSKDILKPRGFTLPEKWCVKVTEESIDKLGEWREGGEIGKNNIGLLYTCSLLYDTRGWNLAEIEREFPEFTEITYQQFIEHVYTPWKFLKNVKGGQVVYTHTKDDGTIEEIRETTTPLNLPLTVDDFNVGDEIIITSRPSLWASGAGGIDPLGVGVTIFPYRCTISKIGIDGVKSIKDNYGYGWCMDTLIEEGKVEKVSTYEGNWDWVAPMVEQMFQQLIGDQTERPFNPIVQDPNKDKITIPKIIHRKLENKVPKICKAQKVTLPLHQKKSKKVFVPTIKTNKINF